MDTSIIWTIVGLIVLLNLLFVGFSSAFFLCLVITVIYNSYKFCLTNHVSFLSPFFDLFLAPWMEETLSARKIIKVLKKKDKNDNYFCFICQERQCFKHGPESKIDLFPERKILIDSQLNRQLQECIDLCLKDVETLNQNPPLKQEVKRCIAFMVGNFMLRSNERFNPTNLVSKRLLTTLTQHLNLFLEGKRKAKSAYYIPEHVIEEYKKEGFYCDSSYLRALIKSCQHLLISPKIISNSTVQLFSLELFVNGVLEPFIDLISHPYYFNTFFILLFNGVSSPTQSSQSSESNSSSSGLNIDSSNLVTLLENFSYPIDCDGENSLGLNLREIIKDEQALFIFMQFLKDEGVVNLLQFLLSVESFNQKLLKPDLSDEQKMKLSSELELIMKEFFDETSADYIHFKDPLIKQSLQKIIDKKDIILLQTEDPLYKAYDIIYNFIDQTYLPYFLRSSFYLKLIAGTRHAQSPSCQAYDDDNISISSLVSSLNGMCKKSSTYDDFKETLGKAEDTKSEKDVQVVHDLSSWIVWIERVEKGARIITSSSFDEDDIDDDEDKLVYLIKVTDSKCDESWEVQRGFDEFHVLQSKLRQFHGNIRGVDIQLPKRRTQLFSSTFNYSCTSSNIALLEGYTSDLQKFLDTLLSNSVLQSSSLLHSFLNSNTSSSHFNSNNIDFKKLIRNLNSSLMLKGGSDIKTSLLPFISNLINSTTSRPMEEIDEAFEVMPEDTLIAPNNSSANAKSWPTLESVQSKAPKIKDLYERQNAQDYSSTESDIEERDNSDGNSLYSLIYFVLKNIYNLNETKSKLFFFFKVCKPILKDTLQLVLYIIINRKLKGVLTIENLSYSLDTLKNSLQSKNSSERSDKDNEKLVKETESQALKALQVNLQSYLPLPIVSSLSFHLYYCFQFQVINKQFIYLLLSQIFQILFPEITKH